eukprot:761837-Hanusia_phi.AAC.8
MNFCFSSSSLSAESVMKVVSEVSRSSDSIVLCWAPTQRMFFAVAGDPIVKRPKSPSLPAAQEARNSIVKERQGRA